MSDFEVYKTHDGAGNRNQDLYTQPSGQIVDKVE